MYRNILLPTDGTPKCRAAILAGVAIAKATGASVTGVYAAPPATPIVYRNLLPVHYGTPREHEKLIAEASQKALAIVEKAAKAAGVPCELVTMTSDFPADVILAVAKKKKCDLIVMASHSRKGLSAILLGSQTQKVLAASTVPVLVHR